MPVKACFLGRAINSRLSSKMASTFPAAIANEPPPLDASSEDEDSEEFRSHGLKLDVPSGAFLMTYGLNVNGIICVLMILIVFVMDKICLSLPLN